MIRADRQRSALKAIHNLLIVGRIMAYENTPSEVMFRFFDDLEYFPALMLDPRDCTERFGYFLESTGETFNCKWISEWYQRNYTGDGKHKGEDGPTV